LRFKNTNLLSSMCQTLQNGFILWCTTRLYIHLHPSKGAHSQPK